MSAFTTIWSLIAQRSIANWRMTTILGAGILVAATLLASAPIYARSMDDLGVTFAIRDALQDDATVRMVFLDTELATAGAAANFEPVEARIDEQLGWFEDSRRRTIVSANFRIKLPGQELAEDTTRGRAFTLQGWESHVRVVEGELPEAAGAGEPLQIAMHEQGAEFAGLSVGDAFQLVEWFDTCQRVVQTDQPPLPCSSAAVVNYNFPAALTAIVAARDEEDPFWYPSYNTFFRRGDAMIRQQGLVPQIFMPEASLTDDIGGRFPAYTGDPSLGT